MSCVRTALTDLVIEMDELEGISLPEVKTWPCRIESLRHASADVLVVKLRLPPNAEFIYLPGQYIDVTGPRGLRRSYSIANSTSSAKFIELHVREVNGGAMSEYWFSQAKINDLLRFRGPLGTFVLRHSSAARNVVFLATGTGIAPVKAMLESIATMPKDDAPKSVSVYWGGREPNDFYIDLSRVMGTGTFVPVLSRARSGWSGMQGYVQHAFLAHHQSVSNIDVYACGSEVMIHDAKKVLLQSGLPAAQFHSDAFVCTGSV